MIDAGDPPAFPVCVAMADADGRRWRTRAGGWRAVALAAVQSLALFSGCGEAADPPRHLLLITVDTLRADRLAAWGGERGLTPRLDALAREGVVFLRAYAPSAFTLPSVATLMTGRYPQEMGIRKNESGLPEAAETLAEALLARGWRTAAVVSNFVLREKSGVGAGFELFDDVLPQREAVRGWPERVAADTTTAALEIIDGCTAGGRCFLWVHYQDPHGPYTPSDESRRRHLQIERAAPGGDRRLPVNADDEPFGGIPRYQYFKGRRDAAFYRAGYAAEVAAADAEIGRLLDGFSERGLLERTLVVFAADHGEALGEDDYWFAHGELLSDVLVRVPLVIREPGRASGERRDPVSLADLYPTILARVVGEPPGPDRIGRDLLVAGAEAQASTPYLATLGASRVERYGLVDGEYKLVVSESDSGREERFTRTAAGVAEVELVGSEPAIEASLRAKLAALRREMAGGPPETRQDLTTEERAKLRSLGYVSEP